MPLVLLLLFVGVPLVELYVLIQVGSVIGALATIGLCILTAALGVSLIRIQGLQTLMRARDSVGRGQLPAMEMFEGVGLAAAGILLLTPGFATDALGFALLVPPLRRSAIVAVLARMQVRHGSRWHRDLRNSRGRKGHTIEGEYRRKDEDEPPR